MAPAGAEPRLCGSTPVEEVRVSVEGLTGSARAAALAAADAVKGAQSVRGLDELLRGGAVAQAHAAARARGTPLEVEVSPGPKRGVVDVAFRVAPPVAGTWCFATQAGLEE